MHDMRWSQKSQFNRGDSGVNSNEKAGCMIELDKLLITSGLESDA